MRQFHLFLVPFLLLISMSVRAQDEAAQDTTKFARLQFESTAYDFKELNQGEKMTHTFEFENTGSIPLIINNVLTTCGCTAPEWPKEPVKPGAKGQIKVVFDSSSKIGRQNKVITIRSNAKSGDVRLRISGMVLPPKKK